MGRLLGTLYGVACYAISMASFLGLILFSNNHLGILGFDELLPYNVDAVNVTLAVNPLIVNLGLLLLFGVQHSVMARPSFKASLAKVLPSNLERSTYVLATAVVAFTLIYYWQPMEGSLWQVQDETARMAITVLFYIGWMIAVLATFMLNHFHLFGLQQSIKSDDPDAGSKVFRTPMFYSIVRHPIQTGIAIAMIATPDMTMGRAVLAAGMLIYIVIGLHFEERDLIREFGDTYRDYRKKVPGVIPFSGGSKD